ncbi:hypothetical protein QRX60_50310 [Amycolatopsis mongoliensis]|uniref:Uncharacterized protein n=1 Tax=Amycolatopsis mongoliensis TaxID=715475 RepID=A0A9Y2NES1_9PSEU|nr:hypothetical protein [Amycolatopsis sp. 4-36]WIY02102.1 hypothetical protein QRX60_50310 [Amycolatopsis sp. 4-36]
MQRSRRADLRLIHACGKYFSCLCDDCLSGFQVVHQSSRPVRREAYPHPATSFPASLQDPLAAENIHVVFKAASLDFDGLANELEFAPPHVDKKSYDEQANGREQLTIKGAIWPAVLQFILLRQSHLSGSGRGGRNRGQ